MAKTRAQQARDTSRQHDPTATKVDENTGNANSISKMSKILGYTHRTHEIAMSSQALVGGPTHVFDA